jgi:predicted nucleic acid-binding protein
MGMIVVGLMQRFPNVRLVPIDASLAALSAQLAVALRLLGADSLYIATAHRLGVSLITLDREQRDRSVTSVTAFTPEESLQ